MYFKPKKFQVFMFKPKIQKKKNSFSKFNAQARNLVEKRTIYFNVRRCDSLTSRRL